MKVQNFVVETEFESRTGPDRVKLGCSVSASWSVMRCGLVLIGSGFWAVMRLGLVC